MCPKSLETHSLRHWFTGLVEQSLYTQVGLASPGVADYLADLLMDFLHADHIFRLHDAGGRRIDQVSEMISETAPEPGMSDVDHRRRVHIHIGDFTLFWTGVYPENLRLLRGPRRSDQLVDYLSQGKRSYWIASELTTDDAKPPASLLRCLSDRFEDCVYGLSCVRREWEEQRRSRFSPPQLPSS
ncbi:MAG: hypothetical protein L6Q92_05340 [Phycisphaerae bacterium]|nr:hypothetical protein [Phycisphaerae bacterium]